MLCGSSGILLLLVACSSGALIRNVPLRTTPDKPEKEVAILNKNGTEEQIECLENLEENNASALASLTPSVKQKRCPRERRLGMSFNPNQNAIIGSRASVPIERRDLRDHLAATCEKCKVKHNCVGDPCPLCDVYCKTLAFLPSKQTNENTVGESNKPIIKLPHLVTKQEPLPLENRIASIEEAEVVGSAQDNKNEENDNEFSDISKNDEKVLIVGSPNILEELERNPPLGPPTNSILGEIENEGGPRVSLTSRSGDVDGDRTYTIATMDSGNVKEIILQLTGIRNTTDIDKVIVLVTTRSNQPPLQTQADQSSFPPPYEKIADTIKKALHRALEKKIREEGINFLSNEDVDKIILEILSKMQQSPSNTETVGMENNLDDPMMRQEPIELGGIIVPQSANPAIIEGPPSVDALQDARMNEQMAISPSETKFNVVTPDEYLGWSKNSNTATRLGMPNDYGVQDELERIPFGDPSSDFVAQPENESTFQSIDVTHPKLPTSADQSVDFVPSESVGEESDNLREASQPKESRKLSSPHATFNKMMDNFRNTWNSKGEGNNEEQLGEADPKFKHKLSKIPVIIIPKPFKHPFQKFRSNDADTDPTVEDNVPLGINEEESAIPANFLASGNDPDITASGQPESLQSKSDADQKLSLKEMAQQMIEDYKTRREEKIKRLGSTKTINNQNSELVKEAEKNLETENRTKQNADESDYDEIATDRLAAKAINDNRRLDVPNKETLRTDGGESLAPDILAANAGIEDGRLEEPNEETLRIEGEESLKNHIDGSVIKEEDNISNNQADTARISENDIPPKPNQRIGDLEFGSLDQSNGQNNPGSFISSGNQENHQFDNNIDATSLSKPNPRNQNSLLDAGPFVSSDKNNGLLEPLSRQNVDLNGNLDGTQLGNSFADNRKEILDAGPFTLLGRQVHNKYLPELKRKMDEQNTEVDEFAGDARQSVSDIMGERNIGAVNLQEQHPHERSQWSPSATAIRDFEVAQKALGKIQELSEKLQQETRLRKPIDEAKLESLLTDIEPVVTDANKVMDSVMEDITNTVKDTINPTSENEPLSGNNQNRDSIIGSQPLENSWENLQPTVPRFVHKDQGMKDSIVGESAHSENAATIATQTRAQFTDPVASVLKDQNDIEFALDNPRELYFVSNGDKLPLQFSKKENGEIHLSVDVDKLCSCKNSSCPSNHTAIEDTVGSILEKEAELQEELKPTVGRAKLQNSDDSVLGMDRKSVGLKDSITGISSRSFLNNISEAKGGTDLVNRNEREINENKSLDTLESESENLELFRRSLDKNLENQVTTEEIVSMQSAMLKPTQIGTIVVTTELPIPTQTIFVGERTKLTPNNHVSTTGAPNYFKNFFSKLRSDFSSWNKPTETTTNKGFQVPDLFKNFFKLGSKESTTASSLATPMLGSRIKENSDETRDHKWPISNPFKFNKLDNQLKKLEKIDKSVDAYVKENDKILEQEAKTILGSNQDPAVKNEIGIMSNILNWFKKLATDRPKK